MIFCRTLTEYIQIIFCHHNKIGGALYHCKFFQAVQYHRLLNNKQVTSPISTFAGLVIIICLLACLLGGQCCVCVLFCAWSQRRSHLQFFASLEHFGARHEYCCTEANMAAMTIVQCTSIELVFFHKTHILANKRASQMESYSRNLTIQLP